MLLVPEHREGEEVKRQVLMEKRKRKSESGVVQLTSESGWLFADGNITTGEDKEQDVD